MTDYADLDTVNALYAESQSIDKAISMIDGGGNIGSVAVTPPPFDPAAPPSTMMMMTVVVTTPTPTAPATLATFRSILVDRQTAIASELSALGITATPAVRTQKPKAK